MDSSTSNFNPNDSSWDIISKLFNLAKKEFVYDDFSCSLWNKILFPGHLYCMENHLCFYGNMMGAETKVIISIEEIEDIHKKSSLGFKSGIEISCKNKKNYYFTGFSDREAVFDLMNNIWKGSSQEDIKFEEGAQKTNGDTPKVSNQDKEEIKEEKKEDGDKVEVKGYIELPIKKEGKVFETIKLIVFMSIDKFFDLFIADNAVFSNYDRLQMHGANNIVTTPWKLNDKTGLNERTIDFNIKISDLPFGAKSTRVHCDHSYKRSEGALEVIRMSRSLDVPYGNTFQLEEKWMITEFEGSSNKILVLMTGAVVFDKFCAFEKLVRSMSSKELSKDHDLWYKTAKEKNLLGERQSPDVLKKQTTSSKKELKHEIEKSEELNYGLEEGLRSRKDLHKKGKVDEQLASMRKGMNMLGLLLLITILLFLTTLFIMNQKISSLQSKIEYLESLPRIVSQLPSSDSSEILTAVKEEALNVAL